MPRALKRLRDGREVLGVDYATLEQDEVAVLDSLDSILKDVQQHAPASAEKLAVFRWMFETLRNLNPSRSGTLSATSLDTIVKATAAVGVIYNPHNAEHLWQLKGDKDLSDGQLSAWADTCITEFTSTNYFRLADSETLCRTVLNVIFCDRLRHLKDYAADGQLNWVPEMPLSIRSKFLNRVIHGKADWCLGHGNLRTEPDATLVVLVTKRIGSLSEALPQLIIYLAAAQDRRKESGKINCSIFGLFTDSADYKFARLDPNRKLFVSKTYSWIGEKNQIIQCIDKILRDSIEASLHTTLIKPANTTTGPYEDRFNEETTLNL